MTNFATPCHQKRGIFSPEVKSPTCSKSIKEMIVLLSPAKSLDFSPLKDVKYSQPRLLERSEELVANLKKKSSKSLQTLMGVSKKIADLNVEKFRSFQVPFSPENAKQAMYAFNGDVYMGLEASSFDENEIGFAQKHIRLLSGLYGVLKPLDLIQPYRLEMGTKLKYRRKKNLYEYWGKAITELINEDLSITENNIVLNLASKEYFNAIKKDALKGKIVHVDFLENRNGQLKIISFNAKKARGRLAHIIVKEKIVDPIDFKELVVNDYIFNQEKSSEEKYCFIKD